MNQGASKIVLGLVGLFVAALFDLHTTLKFEPEAVTLFIVVTAVFIECKAGTHKLYGFTPATFPLYIYLALMPKGSIGAAAVVAITAVAIRQALASRESASTKAWEFVVDSLSVCAALAALKALTEFGPRWDEVPILAVLAAAFCYFFLRPILQNAWFGELPEESRKTWEEDILNATPLLTLTSFLAIPYGFMSALDERIGFILPIAPFLLSSAMTPLIDSRRDPNRIRLNQSLNPLGSTTPASSSSGDGPASAATALDLRQEDFSHMHQLCETVTQQPSVQKVLEEILWLAKRVANCDSAVIFLQDDGKLRPWEESKSPSKDALMKAFFEDRLEPVVRRAFHHNRADFLRAEDSEDGRVFEDETAAVAVPMHNTGVIYLGRIESEIFTDEEVSRLIVLGQEGHLAVRLARLQEAAEGLRTSEAEAQEETGFFRRAVSDALVLMSELGRLERSEDDDVRPVLEKAALGLGRMVSHDYWAILYGEPGQWPPKHHLTGPPSKPQTEEKALSKIANRVVERGQALLENDLKESDLPQPSKGSRSVLAAPLFGGGACFGAILLFSSKSGAFRESERDLLALMGYQFGSLLAGGGEDDLQSARHQLVQSSKMAALGQLSAGVAHELATPLGALMLALEGAIKTLETKPERSKQRMEKALKSGNQLKKIAARLLFYSRESVIEDEETDLNQVVHDTIEVVGHQLSLDDIEVKFELGEELAMVVANRNELQQIVINLLTNAKDAVLAREDDGPRTITITTSDHPKAVELAVADTGVGITEEDQAKVFRAFYTTKKAGSGTGLGLSVTKELVEKHGGAIRVQSKLGEGTRFVLRLPRV